MIAFGLCVLGLIVGYAIGVHGTLRWVRHLSATEAAREGLSSRGNGVLQDGSQPERMR